jgi:hypothetical protein
MPKSKSSKSSKPLMTIQKELAELDKQYDANKDRIEYLQSLLTPKLSHLAQLASERHPIPHMNTHLTDVQAERFVRGASGAITSFRYPDEVDIGIKYPYKNHGIAKPSSVGRIHVNLKPKHKGGRSRKHKVRSQPRRKSSRRNH